MTYSTTSSSYRVLLGLATMGLGIIMLAAACDSDVSACETVQGTVTGQSVPILNDAGVPTGFRVEKATVAGAMSGTSSATFTIERADEDGTMHLTGSHTFWDGDDAFLFRTRDEGLTTADGRVENTMTIVEGATGSLTTTGSVNLQTGALVLDYTGEVCR
jgi:hypothetical protein